MRQMALRSFLRPLVSAAAGCVVLVAGCAAGGGAPAPATAAQLVTSARAALSGGQPCQIHGDVIVGPTARIYDTVSSVSAGHKFRALITEHLPGARPLAVPQHLLDDGAALYFHSLAQLKLNFESKVPARVAKSWIRFPSWPAMSKHAYNAEFSALSQLPGQAGQAVDYVAMDSVNAIYQGSSCRLLLDRIREHIDEAGRVVHAKLDGQPVLKFTIMHVFTALSGVQYHITVSRSRPFRLLRITSGRDVLTFSYPATIAPISAPPAAEVIPASELAKALAGK